MVENLDLANFDPIVHAGGLTTFADREPYHHSFALLAEVCQAVGACLERLSSVTNPLGQSVLLITRNPRT